MLTLNEQDEKVIDKIISATATYIHIESMQPTPVTVLSFPGLEIRQHQRRVLGDESEFQKIEKEEKKTTKKKKQ